MNEMNYTGSATRAAGRGRSFGASKGIMVIQLSWEDVSQSSFWRYLATEAMPYPLATILMREKIQPTEGVQCASV